MKSASTVSSGSSAGIKARRRAAEARRRRAVELVQSYVAWVAERPSPRYVFRGQSAPRPLIPTIGRNAARYKPEKERQLLSEFKRNAVPFLEGRSVNSDWEWLSIAQHHGLPTRLLDWSTNAMVAAYFANQSLPTDGKYGVVFAVRPSQYVVVELVSGGEDDPFSLGDIGFIFPPALAARIASQRGMFSVHPSPTTPLDVDKADQFRFPTELKVDTMRCCIDLALTNTPSWVDSMGWPPL